MADAAVSCRGIAATIYVDNGVIVGGPLDGSPYNRMILGTRQDDVIVGTTARDIIGGFGGHDIICAEDGKDIVFGGGGRDILDGGLGVDIVFGGPGLDRCANAERRRSCAPPPDYPPYEPLMDQVSFLGPLYATGATEVPVAALEDAETMLAVMLRHRRDVVETLQAAGALTAVFGRDQTVCDLPYFSDLSGQPICEDATGGLGGVPGRPATACSERNVLKQTDDPFGRGTRDDGENVCVHELAHTIMNVGLTDAERFAIQERFVAVLSEGLWVGDFALVHVDEFFAEMSQTYFCANPEIPTFLHRGTNCAAELQAYDPLTFSLIDGIYRRPADLR